LQHMRVGADGGIGVKYMAREDASVVGMLGSGGMARTHMEAFTCVRDIRRLQVYSPTPANREAFAEEMARKYGIEAVACDDPREVYRDADIVAGLTDSAVPVLNGEWIEPGAHVVNVGGGGGRPDPGTLERVDVYLRFGSAPAPWGLPEMALEDEYITYAAQPRFNANFRMKRSGRRGHGAALPDRMITFRDIVEGTNRGRTSARQRSPIPSAATFRAPSSGRWAAWSTRRRGPPGSATRFRPSGCSRTSGTDRVPSRARSQRRITILSLGMSTVAAIITRHRATR